MQCHHWSIHSIHAWWELSDVFEHFPLVTCQQVVFQISYPACAGLLCSYSTARIFADVQGDNLIMQESCLLITKRRFINLLIARHCCKITFTLFWKWAEKRHFFFGFLSDDVAFRSPELVAVQNCLKSLDRHNSPSAVMLVPDEQTTQLLSVKIRLNVSTMINTTCHLQINTGIIFVAAGNAGRFHL